MSAANIQKHRKEVLQKIPDKIKWDFLDLLKVQSSSDNEKRMVVYIIDRLRKMGLDFTIDPIGNILVQKGNTDTFPCIVAHMDTVHVVRDDVKLRITIKDKREIVTAYHLDEQVGTGGDDKNGIYAVFYMLQNFENIKAVFFTQEETGLVGSGKVNHDWFDDVGYIIQLDRWGRGDFIAINYSSKTINEEYEKIATPILKEFGYAICEGLFTDSIGLWNDGVGVSCVNVSCGYYMHHTDKEEIDLNEFWNSLLFTKRLIEELGENRYKSDYVEHYRDYDDWRYGYGSWSYGSGNKTRYNKHGSSFSYHKQSGNSHYTQSEKEKFQNLALAEVLSKNKVTTATEAKAKLFDVFNKEYRILTDYYCLPLLYWEFAAVVDDYFAVPKALPPTNGSTKKPIIADTFDEEEYSEYDTFEEYLEANEEADIHLLTVIDMVIDELEFEFGIGDIRECLKDYPVDIVNAFNEKLEMFSCTPVNTNELEQILKKYYEYNNEQQTP